jgi:hypothetical protein
MFSPPAEASIKLSVHHSWIKELKVCSNKELGPLQWGDNNKNAKMGGVI